MQRMPRTARVRGEAHPAAHGRIGRGESRKQVPDTKLRHVRTLVNADPRVTRSLVLMNVVIAAEVGEAYDRSARPAEGVLLRIVSSTHLRIERTCAGNQGATQLRKALAEQDAVEFRFPAFLCCIDQEGLRLIGSRRAAGADNHGIRFQDIALHLALGFPSSSLLFLGCGCLLLQPDKTASFVNLGPRTLRVPGREISPFYSRD